MDRFVAAVLAVLIGGAAPPASADTYKLDRDHTEVRFTWDHLGLSRQGGRFLDVSGTVTFDPANPETSAVDVRIPLKSIATGVKALDEHLVKSKDFFDMAQFPEAAFKSTRVLRTDERVAEVMGDLTLNGVTKPVVLDVVWNFTGEHPLANINPTYAGHFSSGFSATTQILRSDFGITRTIPFISDEIRITIETEMHREGPPAITALPATPGEAPMTPPDAPAGPEPAPGPSPLPGPVPDVASPPAAPTP